MGHAEATLGHVGGQKRVMVRTVVSRGVNDFDFMLACCKSVGGGSFSRKYQAWHYPATVDTCLKLRRTFGERLRVGNDLSEWYRKAVVAQREQTNLSYETDAKLTKVSEELSRWLHGYQRVGAKWISQGYRGAGLVADKPGVGKTPQALAALVEADVQGPVLVVCPKKSVRLVWGLEAKRHLPNVPIYLCQGSRAQRERTLAKFARDMKENPNRLRIVVVVAEMLRVNMGNPCYTTEVEERDEGPIRVAKNKVTPMCPVKRRGQECTRHIQVDVDTSTKTKKQKNLVPTGFVYPELFNPDLLGGGWSWIILDESHKLLGSLTIVKGNLMGEGLRLLPERTDRRRYCMSGTPFGKGGRVQGMFGTLNWLWPDEYTSYWRWVKDKFEVEEKQINKRGNTALKIGGLKGLRPDATPEEENEAWESFLAELGPRILRRTKEETFKDLPPKTYYEVVCELTRKQKEQYEELVAFAEVTTPNGSVTPNGHLAMATRANQIALGAINGPNDNVIFSEDSGKLDELWEALDRRGILDGLPGDKIIIASRFNKFLDIISEYLVADAVKHFRLDGSTPPNQAERMVIDWQNPQSHSSVRVFLVNTKAGGISINLDAADEMHIMDEDPDPGVNEQLEDRIHRASRNHKVRIFYYRTEGTMEYEQAHNVEYRRRLQHAVLDGRRGQEYIRDMIVEARKEVL